MSEFSESYHLRSERQEDAGYRCDWEDEIRFDDSQYSRAALQQLVPSLQPSLLDEFEKQLHPTDFDELFEADPSKLFAQALGLAHYDWLSYDYVAHNIHDSPKDFSGVVEVT
jgi:hypothetical protein